MQSNTYFNLLWIELLLIFAVSAQAHHSFVIYNGTKYTTYKGILISENFNVGSHARFEFEVTLEDGTKNVLKADIKQQGYGQKIVQRS